MDFEYAHLGVKEEDKNLYKVYFNVMEIICKQFGKNHFDLGKIKDFHMLNFGNAHLGVKEEDKNLYKVSLNMIEIICKHLFMEII